MEKVSSIENTIFRYIIIISVETFQVVFSFLLNFNMYLRALLRLRLLINIILDFFINC